MSRDTNGNEPRHPIRVVSSRTGLPQDVLRAWERRYEAVVPHRTETGRRLYTDQDVEKLSFLRRAVESGRRISDVAPLAIHELRELVQEDRDASATVEPRQSSGPARSAGAFVKKGMAAIQNLDGKALDSMLADASLDLTPAALRAEVLHPILDRVGRSWRSGSLRIAHEHLASAIVRSFLGSQRLGHDVPAGAPAVVITTPAGQRHELGALMAAIAALEVGWDVLYLGANLPAAEIAAAARQKEARAVALSLTCPAADPTLLEELRDLRRLLGPTVPVFAGGAVVESYHTVLKEIGARCVDELAGFQAALDTLPR
jgi:DNA-binding transcriptional MerR regulator/methylmalonyl-CoA mutase cobalamin-binding subunit